MHKIETIKSYYESNMGKNLPDYKILGWESEEAQRLRFDILASHVNLENKKILDVGCGLGNLLEYLNEKGINVEYTGVDILPKMIECAKRKNLNGTFCCLDIFEANPFKTESFDVIYASGIFNLNLGNNREFLLKALHLFNSLSREAIVFNLLHYRSPGREDRYYYFNPDEVRQMIGEVFSNIKSIRIIEGYLLNDFSVLCEKA